MVIKKPKQKKKERQKKTKANEPSDWKNTFEGDAIIQGFLNTINSPIKSIKNKNGGL